MARDRFEEVLGLLLDDDITREQLDELLAIAAADTTRLQQLRDHLMLSDRLSQYEDALRDEQRFLAALQVRAAASDESDNFVNQVVASIRGEADGDDDLHAAAARTKQDQRGRNARGLAGWITAIVALSLLAAVFFYQVFDRVAEQTHQGNVEEVAAAAQVSDNGVAVLTRVVGLQQATGDWRVGETIPPGTMAWETGLVQLEFYSGATVVVEGPAKLEILDESRVVCRMGRLRAHVPELARGFAVLAPSFELVDLGTEFGLNVSDSGAAEVHVFDGKVELYDVQSNRNAATRRELNAGDALTVARDGSSQPIAARDAEFVTPTRLSQMTDVRRQAQLRDWQAFRDSLLSDPRVVAYFPFDRSDADDRLLVGHRADGSTLTGAIVGCEWAEGRWPEKSSLQFKRPGDRVRIVVPGKFESVSYSIWLRVDGLDRQYNSLLLTDGFDENGLHWQIRQNGSLLLGMRSRHGSANYQTDSIFNLFRLGQWMHLATVYDAEHACVIHYVNGELVQREPLKLPAEGLLTIGHATVGNWSVPTARHIGSSVRNFNGCIDELIVFKQAIDDQQVRQIYEVGRP